MNLSKNFTLSELTKSQAAIRYGISNTPTPAKIENLKRLCETVLQPIRDYYYSKYGWVLSPSSGYRSPELNLLIGGSSTSQHCKGEACDFDYDQYGYPLENIICDIVDLNLPFDQLILEYPPTGWIHVSYKSAVNRKQILRCTSINGKPTYQPYKPHRVNWNG